MRDRFTHRSRTGRGSIPKDMRLGVFERDGFVCQFCGRKRDAAGLTIDHLIPVSQGGLDEMVNWVTACRECNERKADMPLSEFARNIRIDVGELPIHGDPVVDNVDLPVEIRELRKRLIVRARQGELPLTGHHAQNKLEKAYRREFWGTPEGKQLEAEFPTLPEPVRVMIPEIEAVAGDAREFLILVELAKSANTRNLIGTLLVAGCGVEAQVRRLLEREGDTPLGKRLAWALRRFEAEALRRGL
jgi:5-methylcytosine-specific restriction protein A